MLKTKQRARYNKSMPTWVEKMYCKTSYDDRCDDKRHDGCHDKRHDRCHDKRHDRCDKCPQSEKGHGPCCKEPIQCNALDPTNCHPFNPNIPRTLREVLLSLINEQVQVTTPFGPITGTLLVVKCDYIVIVEASGAQVLVPIDKIELVSEL
ncbi:DUF2642 domain-containing protein [Ornithinibacillus sp. L9]|uniref:DUF2642 domain-containing protein n=1 Tax=Ornithinibacillus caprae TaxID=2678566 RepID=A0A6N8FGP9_9BACI|nr:DUF2642 domain-containing protein [Ornithinibacillus caprae]MUK87444.1 DUF2642 domain-containing protein [Ornithinibacillus caprae]